MKVITFDEIGEPCPVPLPYSVRDWRISTMLENAAISSAAYSTMKKAPSNASAEYMDVLKASVSTLVAEAQRVHETLFDLRIDDADTTDRQVDSGR